MAPPQHPFALPGGRAMPEQPAIFPSITKAKAASLSKLEESDAQLYGRDFTRLCQTRDRRVPLRPKKSQKGSAKAQKAGQKRLEGQQKQAQQEGSQGLPELISRPVLPIDPRYSAPPRTPRYNCRLSRRSRPGRRSQSGGHRHPTSGGIRRTRAGTGHPMWTYIAGMGHTMDENTDC